MQYIDPAELGLTDLFDEQWMNAILFQFNGLDQWLQHSAEHSSAQHAIHRLQSHTNDMMLMDSACRNRDIDVMRWVIHNVNIIEVMRQSVQCMDPTHSHQPIKYFLKHPARFFKRTLCNHPTDKSQSTDPFCPTIQHSQLIIDHCVSNRHQKHYLAINILSAHQKSNNRQQDVINYLIDQTLEGLMDHTILDSFNIQYLILMNQQIFFNTIQQRIKDHQIDQFNKVFIFNACNVIINAYDTEYMRSIVVNVIDNHFGSDLPDTKIIITKKWLSEFRTLRYADVAALRDLKELLCDSSINR